MVFALEHMANGLLVGSSHYIILALGLSLIFSLGGVVNLAHGAFYALGAYFAFEDQRRLGFAGAVVIAPVLVGIIGMVIETLFIRRLYARTRRSRSCSPSASPWRPSRACA